MESGDVGPVESGTAASLEESPSGDGVVADAAAKDSESRPQDDEDAISDIESDGGADLATRRAAASGVYTAAEPDEHDESMDPIEDTDAVPDAETQDPALGETMPPEVLGCLSFWLFKHIEIDPVACLSGCKWRGAHGRLTGIACRIVC